MSFLLVLVVLLLSASVLTYGAPLLALTSNYTINDGGIPYQLVCSEEDNQCLSFTQVKYSYVLDSQSLFDELQTCNWDRFVIITSRDLGKTVREHARHLLAPRTLTSTMYYEILNTNWQPEAIQKIIRTAYSQQSMRNFIWVTRKHNEVMKAAQHVFDRERCGNGALMVSRSNFIFVTIDPDITNDVHQMVNSQFDNVAFLVINQDSPILEKAYTLMWRENKRRDLQEISNLSNVSADGLSNTCKIFPNIANGLNGRTLVGLAKEWLPEFFKAPNLNTGKLEYSGFYIDVFNVLASTLNFTYMLVPPADEDNNITWDGYVTIVEDCKVDFGINMFTNNAIFQYNATTSFPVLYNNYVGAYINNEKPDPFKLFLVFKMETYFVLFSCLFFCVFLYLLIAYLLSPLDEDLGWLAEDKEGIRETSQQHVVKTRSSSFFEDDWQNKYKRLETLNTFSDSSTFSSRTEYRLKQDNQHRNQNSSSEKTHRRAIFYIKNSLKNVKCCTQKCNKNKNNSKLLNNKSNNCNNDKMMNVCTKETQTGRRDSLYNNSSHYATDFANKDLEMEFENKKEASIFNLTSSRVKVDTGEQVVSNTGQKINNSLKGIDPRSLSRFEICVDVYFGFCGSMLSQGTLPQPQNWTHRVLLSSWSLMMIVLISTFTGNLTSSFADETDVVIIRTFEELLGKSDFRWGAMNETVIFSIMKSSNNGSTLHKLYEGLDRFKQSDPTVLGNFEDLINNLKSGKFVALITSFVFEYLEDYTDFPGLTLIPDSLLTANGGFLFPQNSELNALISKQIIAMRDCGIINNIFQRLRLSSNLTQRVVDESSNLYLTIDNMQGLFIVILSGAAVAVVTLIVEILVPKLKSQRLH